MLEEAFTLGLRMGGWKYIAPQTKPTPDWLKNKKIESGLTKEIQLYNLKDDIGETKNVADENPGVVKEMEAKLQKIEE